LRLLGRGRRLLLLRRRGGHGQHDRLRRRHVGLGLGCVCHRRVGLLLYCLRCGRDPDRGRRHGSCGCRGLRGPARFV
ncbi:hypothetical protein LTR53_020107, partial [Teratosphaeriaceae sp. CCFEE 6253]